MRIHALTALLAFASIALLSAAPAISADAPPNVERKVLQQTDAPGGNTVSLVQVTIPPGGREGVHTHPGPLIVHVLSGALTLDYEGKPTITYKPGESFAVKAGDVHQGHNMGTVPVVAIATMVTPKGEPLTKQQ
jgi:quercetin dioxygenase-like cupin family protein